MGKRITKIGILAVVALALVLGLASAALGTSWGDLPDNLLASYGVTASQVAAISSGYPDGTFRPQRSITRAQFVKMADAAFALAPLAPAVPSFEDVALSDLYYPYIEAAYAAGLINGVGGGLFGPGLTVTREQAIAIIVRAVATEQDFDLTSLTEAQIAAALDGFGDGAQVSTGLRDELAYALLNGITQGTSTGHLAPQATVSRLVAAVLLIRAGATESPSAPTVSSWPTASAIALGQALSASTLTGGVASVPGNFAFTNPSIVPVAAGTFSASVTFTPADTANYSTVVGNVDVTVNAFAPAVVSLSPADGLVAGGTSVTITGFGFTGVTGVSFGSTEATSFAVNSPTQITAVAPAAVLDSGKPSKTVTVRVTTAGGTSADTSADDYLYYTLTITSGSSTETYSLSDLKSRASVSGYWGAHRDGDTNHFYTGVPLLDLLADVGGLPSGHGLKISASDGYLCFYDSDRLAQIANGTYQMWDPRSTTTIADDVETTGSVQLVAAYEMDGGPLNAATGPIRVVLIRPTADRLTEGKYSPFWVMSIEVQ